MKIDIYPKNKVAGLKILLPMIIANSKKKEKPVSNYITLREEENLSFLSVVLLYVIYWRLSIQKFKKWGKLRQLWRNTRWKTESATTTVLRKRKWKSLRMKSDRSFQWKTSWPFRNKGEIFEKNKKVLPIQKKFAKNQNLSQQVDMNEIVKSQK